MVEEGSETLELHASVTATGGLSAYGTGTILDRGAPPSTPSVAGGWAGTGDCDAGILLVRGEANERAGQLPSWLPRIPADEDVRVHYWFRRPSNSRSVRTRPGTGIPEGMAVNGVRHSTGTPSGSRSGEKTELFVGGAVSSRVRAGDYTFSVRWFARVTGSSRLHRSSGPQDYPCTVKVISAPYPAACPAKLVYRRGEYVSVRLGSAGSEGFVFALSSVPRTGGRFRVLTQACAVSRARRLHLLVQGRGGAQGGSGGDVPPGPALVGDCAGEAQHGMEPIRGGREVGRQGHL